MIDPCADPVQVAYIGAIGRSGSTLLARMLGQAPNVVQVGEVCYLWSQSVLRDRLCSCGRPFSACPFWQDVGQAAFGGWDDDRARHADALRRRVERNRNLAPLAVRALALGSTFGAELDEYQALMSRVFRAVQEVSDCSVVVDNSKLPSSAYLLSGTPGLTVRLLHLIRSSHGVSYSWAKDVSRADFDGRSMRTFSTTRSASEWMAYNAAFELMSLLAVPRLTLRYEDFVGSPLAEIQRVLAFLGVPASAASLDYIHEDVVDLVQDHGLWGNPMRVRVGTQRLRVDDAWRSGLSDRTRRGITLLTLPGLLKYGYVGPVWRLAGQR